MFAVAVLVTAARVLAVPYPIFLVLGGSAIGFIPGLPHVELEPDLGPLIFPPPLPASTSSVCAPDVAIGSHLARLGSPPHGGIPEPRR